MSIEKTYECFECPFFTSHKYWNGYELVDEDWCMYHDEEAGVCGSCTREPTYLDEDESEEEDLDEC